MRRTPQSRDQFFFVPPNLPRSYKKHIAAQIIGVAIFIFVWYNLNGGFIPRFLLPRMPYFNVGPDIGCLVFFNVESDASQIHWARSANSRKAVNDAMTNADIHMVSGDVILRGQGTPSQALEPVMGRPPQSQGEISLEEWLQATAVGTKGIRLQLHTMEAVEITLQTLNEFHARKPLKYPVWIHADVLQGPHGSKPVIDHERFIKTLARLFPQCTLSLGWTSGTHTDLSQSGYTWEMVWNMLDLVQSHEQLLHEKHIIFQARLSLVHNSVSQLKWLTDNVPGSSLIVWHEEGDVVVDSDLMYVAYRFPPHSAYFDLSHERLQKVLVQHRHFSRDRVEEAVLRRDEVMFKPEGWLKMGFHKQRNSILPSTEALVLVNPIVHIVSKASYKPTPELSLHGRVTFTNRKNRKPEDYHTGLNIYVRPTEYTIFDNIVGIRCFIGYGGELKISGSNLPSIVPEFSQTARLTQSHGNCYRFKVTDEGTHISLSVRAQQHCHMLESSQEDDTDLVAAVRVEVPKQLKGRDKQHPFVLRMEDNNREGIIDELSVRHR